MHFFDKVVEYAQLQDKIIDNLKQGIPAANSVSLCGRKLNLQAHSLEQAREIRRSLPTANWNKRWNKDCDWWEWTTEIEGFTIDIYAIREAPDKCEKVYEKRMVKVPVAYEEREEEVFVGWDCGHKGEINE
jgi:hypothetical protein